MRGLLNPGHRVSRFWMLDGVTLYKQGIRLVLLDLDNTLVPWHTKEVSPQARAWLQAAACVGLKVFLVTNAVKGRALELAANLSLPCIANARKPFPWALRRVARQEGVSIAACMMVGDQLFTDVLAAKAAGCPVTLVEPMDAREMGWTKLMRRAERWAGRRPL